MKPKFRCIVVVIISGILLQGCSSNKAYFEKGSLIFNNDKYVETSGIYNLGNKLCTTPDGWDVYAIAGDNEHIYLEVSSFLDNYLYVKEDFVYNTANICGVGKGNSPDIYFPDEKMISVITSILKKEPYVLAEDNIANGYSPEWIRVCVKYENDIIGHEVGYFINYEEQKMFYRASDHSIIALSDMEKSIIEDFY